MKLFELWKSYPEQCEARAAIWAELVAAVKAKPAAGAGGCGEAGGPGWWAAEEEDRCSEREE